MLRWYDYVMIGMFAYPISQGLMYNIKIGDGMNDNQLEYALNLFRG